MAKSGNRIHGSLRPRERTAFGTKGFLVDSLMDGTEWSLMKGPRLDVGEWNERCEWFAVWGERGVWLGSTLDRMDWMGATEAFMRQCLQMSRGEFEDAKANWG